MKNNIKFSMFISALFNVAVCCGGVMALADTPWGPERETFTWDNPAAYATFNSITDNPQLGDERNFVRIRELKDGEKYSDNVQLEVGKTYEVYIYYHNNADAHEVGQTAIGIAEGVMMKSSFPAKVGAGKTETVTGMISAQDTQPVEVWDGAYVNANEDIYLRYVPGTATIHNGGTLNGSAIGPDYLFGDGALLGYNKFSGLLPGCNEYAGYVTYQLFADAPNFEVSKSIVNEQDFYKAGDEITFKIRYENKGTMNQVGVVVKDILPNGLGYVAGSAKLYNNNLTDGKSVNDDLMSDNGMNIGDYAGGSGWAELVYKVKVLESVMNCGDLVNKAIISTDDGNKEASVVVMIGDETCEKKTCATNPEMEGCQELPNTGPLEIVLAIIILLGISGGGYYWYRTRKTLKETAAITMGERGDGSGSDDGSSQKPDNMVE